MNIHTGLFLTILVKVRASSEKVLRTAGPMRSAVVRKWVCL
jgi:hypothetical protein